MTSNERKIIKCLWDKKGEAHVRVVSDACGLTSDYTRLLCRSLARAGYLKFEDANVCRLLKKGRSRFEVISIAETQEPPVAVTANVTMLSDELIASSDAGERDTDGKKSGDDEDADQPSADNGELDKVLEKNEAEEDKIESKAEEITPEVETAPEADLEKEPAVEAVTIEEKEMPPHEEAKKTDDDSISAVSLDKVEGAASAEKEKLGQDDKPPEDLAGAPILRFFQKAVQWIKK